MVTQVIVHGMRPCVDGGEVEAAKTHFSRSLAVKGREEVKYVKP